MLQSNTHRRTVRRSVGVSYRLSDKMPSELGSFSLKGVAMAIELVPLTADSRESFILSMKEAFDAFAAQDATFPQDPSEPVISYEVIDESIDHPHAVSYWAIDDEQAVGGVVLNLDPAKPVGGEYDLLFVKVGAQNRDYGLNIIRAVEKRYPQIKTWSLYTPYIEMRNIHFYVNKCGFKIVEFFNAKHPLTLSDGQRDEMSKDEPFFRFEKKILSHKRS